LEYESELVDTILRILKDKVCTLDPLLLLWGVQYTLRSQPFHFVVFAASRIERTLQWPRSTVFCEPPSDGARQSWVHGEAVSQGTNR
jgi:hypothetical protein